LIAPRPRPRFRPGGELRRVPSARKCGFGSLRRPESLGPGPRQRLLRKPHFAKSSGGAFIFRGIVTLSDSISPDSLRLNLRGSKRFGLRRWGRPWRRRDPSFRAFSTSSWRSWALPSPRP
jgi:hypothetical protein